MSPVMDLGFDYAVLAWIHHGPRRKRILRALEQRSDSITPKILARSLSLSLPKVSTTLGGLRRRGLVKLINPDAHRNRFYSITEKGRKMIGRLLDRKGPRR